jgi:acetyltransferase-like isoleucine patch superfamily enzyme
MITRAILFAYHLCKRALKIARSLYYFRRWDVYVHGKIQVGKRRNILIGRHCSVNRGVVIQGFSDTRIGERVVLSVNCMILDGNLDHAHLVKTGMRKHVPSHVLIGNDVWVGAGAIVLPGVTIGARSIVAAGSVVNKAFPEDVLIAGNPARAVKPIERDGTKQGIEAEGVVDMNDGM